MDNFQLSPCSSPVNELDLPAGTHSPPSSIDDLCNMRWQDFERFATHVLQRYYKAYDITVVPTQLSKDGARDGEAVHVFAASDRDHPLAILFRLWIEVKQRGRGHNVDLGDLGKNLVRAINERVSKLIFVTNCDFTSGARDEIQAFCDRVGLAYAFITGEQLLAYHAEAREDDSPAEEQEEEDRPEPSTAPQRPAHAPRSRRRAGPQVRVTGYVASDPFRADQSSLASAVGVRLDQPAFALLDVEVTRSESPVAVRVRLEPPGPGVAGVHAYGAPFSYPLGEGERVRQVFVVWPRQPGTLKLEDFIVRLDAVPDTAISATLRGELRVSPLVLGTWTPPSRQARLSDTVARVRRWTGAPSLDSISIVAGAGTGKSHVLSMLRDLCLFRGVREVYLDGEMEDSGERSLERIFRQLFPVNPESLERSDVDALATWLIGGGMSAPAARGLSESVCEHRGLHLEGLDARRVGELLAVLLSKASEVAPLAVFFEDLHKAGPSTIHLLHETHRFLRALRRGHVLFVCTTRVAPVHGPEWNAAHWQEQLTAFLASEMTTRIELEQLENDEAVELLQRTVGGLGYRDSELLVAQVGCTPFGLHEAVAYLGTMGALEEPVEPERVAVGDPSRLRSVIGVSTGGLERVTAYRLSAVRGAGDEWLADFLDAGACLGKTFDLEVCLRAAGDPPARKADEALRWCERLAVLKASPARPGDVQFDHDLVRRSTLREMGHLRHRQVAQRLYRLLADGAGDVVLAPLAYQAGLADAFETHALRDTRRLQREQRHPEAVRLLYMVVRSLDPELLWHLHGGDPAGWMHGLDDALAAAAPCRVDGIARHERDRRSLSAIRELLPSLIAISSGSSEAVERVVTEGRMLAERVRDREATAVLMYGYGYMLMERNRTWESIDAHENAEATLRVLPRHARSDERKQNLVRLGIGYRDTGRLQLAMDTFRSVMRMRVPGDWDLWGTVLANAGACYFYTDAAAVRRYWERALRVGERRGLPDLRINMEVDVGVLDLLDGDAGGARSRFLRALHDAEQFGMENQVLRSHLNLACLDLLEGEVATAEARLRDAERIGLLHSVGRRLWRVWANLATIREREGDLAASVELDARVLEALAPVLRVNIDRLGRMGATLNRSLLPLGNLAMRAGASPLHAQLLEGLDPALREAGALLAEGCRADPGRLPRLFGRHCRHVHGVPRFLITD
jgi:hypothetical protein